MPYTKYQCAYFFVQSQHAQAVDCTNHKATIANTGSPFQARETVTDSRPGLNLIARAFDPIRKRSQHEECFGVPNFSPRDYNHVKVEQIAPLL